MESGMNAAAVQVGLTGQMDQFVFSKNINDQDYYMFRCAELKTRPCALNPFKKDVAAGPGGEDSYDIDRTGDVILEIDSFLQLPAIAAIGKRVVTEKCDNSGVIGPFEIGNATRAGLRSQGVAEEDIIAVAGTIGKAVNDVAGDLDAIDYATVAANLMEFGGRLVNLSETAAAEALRVAAAWKVEPALAVAAGYSLKTGKIKTDDDELIEVTKENAQIAVRWVDYVAIRAQAYKALYLLQQEQTGFKYMYQYVYQVLLRAAGKKLKSSYAPLDAMYRMASVDKCGCPVHPKSQIEKVYNVTDYVKSNTIGKSDDLLALEKAGKIKALSSDAVKNGHLILFATYTEADREALTEHNFVQLNTQVREESRNLQNPSATGNDFVAPALPKTLNFMLKAMWLLCRTAEAVAAKRWFDLRGIVKDGVTINPFQTVQLEINGKGKFGCTDAEYFNRAAHLSAAEDVSELEASGNHILGLYFATKVTGPLYNGALNASKAGPINIHTTYKPEIFFTADGTKQEIEEHMITAASNLSVYEGGKSGVRFMT
ncbi:unnamed protein product [Symbiodinium sp. KB8]|nr:unnamed protein product [Symbiodinium sp. KB8]